MEAKYKADTDSDYPENIILIDKYRLFIESAKFLIQPITSYQIFTVADTNTDYANTDMGDSNTD